MITQRTATTADYFALLDVLGIREPLPQLRAIQVQIALGRAWRFDRARHGADANPHPHGQIAPLVALAGIVHSPDDSEAWLQTAPGAEADMLGLVRLFRRQIAVDRSLIGRPVVMRISRSNPAGQRIASALGLVLTTKEGAVDVWSTS